MKHFKNILFIVLLAILTISCKKESRYPEFENGANAQFTRDLGTTLATYSSANLSKASPAATDKFTLKVIESGNVSSVRVMVDFVKGTTTLTKKYQEITSWPTSYTISLNDLVALFATDGVTVANLAAGNRFVFRTEVTLTSGTIISEQSAVLAAAPYAIRLTYTVTN